MGSRPRAQLLQLCQQRRSAPPAANGASGLHQPDKLQRTKPHERQRRMVRGGLGPRQSARTSTLTAQRDEVACREDEPRYVLCRFVPPPSGRSASAARTFGAIAEGVRKSAREQAALRAAFDALALLINAPEMSERRPSRLDKRSELPRPRRPEASLLASILSAGLVPSGPGLTCRSESAGASAGLGSSSDPAPSFCESGWDRPGEGRRKTESPR